MTACYAKVPRKLGSQAIRGFRVYPEMPAFAGMTAIEDEATGLRRQIVQLDLA